MQQPVERSLDRGPSAPRGTPLPPAAAAAPVPAPDRAADHRSALAGLHLFIPGVAQNLPGRGAAPWVRKAAWPCASPSIAPAAWWTR